MTSRNSGTQALDRPCPGCGGWGSEVLFRQRFAQIQEVSILSGYDVVACSDCGVCFADQIPDQATFDHYYREASKYEGVGSNATLPNATLKRFEQEVEDIERYLPSKSARVLEVGCATGAMLGMLRARGYANVFGLDPSPACALLAHQFNGVPVRTGNLLSGQLLPAGESGYDLIILIAVLEHVHDVSAALKELRSALRPGGRVFIEVPNAAGFTQNVDAPFQEFSVEHINYFSTASLAAVAKYNGFEVIDLIERDRPHTEGVTAPVVAGVFGLADAPVPIAPDQMTANVIRSYVRTSHQRELPLRACVADVARDESALIVWGCGTLTLRLLATSELANARIAAFVDGNSRYWGKAINGIPILAPHDISGRSERILISTVGHQKEIARFISERLAYPHPILTYPSALAP